ncbi:Palmitoyltransferase ZDHHC15 [Folsomia candida]|uniref:Palmitoyltransferase n=1 Tax=Folsomia candida TaxID=158441 RepID=A0A226ES41_FOLCA|nr:Palmitoyltransferase ZDHHC15 [Folsomia candida]
MGEERTNGIWGTPLFRVLRWVPVIFMVVTMLWGYYVFVVQICLFEMDSLWGKSFTLVIYHLSFIFFFWAHFKTMITYCKPVPPEFKIPQAWVNNCIAFDNYKFFVLFVNYAFTYCFLVTCLALPYFIQAWNEEIRTLGQHQIMSGFFVVVIWLILVTPLYATHLYLVRMNRSTVEFSYPPIFTTGPDKKGFSLGIFDNIAEVFGRDKRKWAFPIFSSLGDGITFPTRYSRLRSTNEECSPISANVDP